MTSEIELDDERVRHLHRRVIELLCVVLTLSLCNTIMLMNISMSLSFV
jgi:hypothetical protein